MESKGLGSGLSVKKESSRVKVRSAVPEEQCCIYSWDAKLILNMGALRLEIQLSA